MRISDWSSDVCSSDLPDEVAVDHLHDAREDGQFGRSDDPDVVEQFREIGPGGYVRRSATRESGKDLPSADLMVHRREDDADHRDLGLYRPEPHQSRFGEDRALGLAGAPRRMDQRSEEHTSELQSLMRISYAVFCLKKKK